MYYGSLLSYKLKRILSHLLELCCCFFLSISYICVWCYFRSIFPFWPLLLVGKLLGSLFSPFSSALIALDDLLHGSVFFSCFFPPFIHFLLFFKRQQTATLYTHRAVCVFCVLAYVLAELCWTAVSDCRYCNRPLSNKLYFRCSVFFLSTSRYVLRFFYIHSLLSPWLSLHTSVYVSVWTRAAVNGNVQCTWGSVHVFPSHGINSAFPPLVVLLLLLLHFTSLHFAYISFSGINFCRNISMNFDNSQCHWSKQIRTLY